MTSGCVGREPCFESGVESLCRVSAVLVRVTCRPLLHPLLPRALASLATMSSLRQTPLTCSGHTRPVVFLAFSEISPEGQYYSISACKDGRSDSYTRITHITEKREIIIKEGLF